MSRPPVLLLFLAGLLSAGSLLAQPGVSNPAKARVDYMLNCQGCHGATGTGTADGSVPTMQDFVGFFLHVPGGREFLVQVPGSANAALDDAALAELLNWMLPQISAQQIPDDFVPYSAEEVGALRSESLSDVEATREALVERIRDAKLIP